jgi:hypothetical protein
MKATGRSLILAAVVVVSAAVTAPVFADFIPLEVKWSQPIVWDAGGVQILGLDRPSDHLFNIVRADDFLCNDPRPIVAVRWWGSYLGPNQTPRPNAPGFTVPFDISFHLSTANGNPSIHPNSLPVDPYLSLQSVLAQQFFVGFDVGGEAVYRYDAYLVDPFVQIPGTEYFLDIDLPNSSEMWGWHETPLNNLDYPAWATGHGGPWNNDPPHDLAFELMVIPEPSGLSLGMMGLALLWILQRCRKIWA